MKTEWKFFMLGLPMWSLVNASWAMLGDLAQFLPEGFTNEQMQKLIWYIMAVGLLAGLLLSWFWDHNSDIFGVDVSISLLVLFFIVGACSSTTSVVNFAYVSAYPAVCTTYMATGMGAGSMIGGVTALLVQGIFTSKFSVSLVFISVASLYLPAMTALQSIQTVSKEMIEERSDSERNSIKGSRDEEAEGENKLLLPPKAEAMEPQDVKTEELTESNFLFGYYEILLLQAFASGLGHGLCPSLISSVCGRFQHPKTTLILATGLAAVFDPVFRFLTDYMRFHTLNDVVIASAVLGLLSGVMVWCAILPSDAAIFSTSWGSAVPVVSNITFISLFVFTNTCIFLVLKDVIPANCIGHAYKWSGLAVQLGAVIGSVLTFLLIIYDVI